MGSTEKSLIPPDKPTVRSTPYDQRLQLYKCFLVDSLYMEAFVTSSKGARGLGIALLRDLLELSEADCKQVLDDAERRMSTK